MTANNYMEDAKREEFLTASSSFRQVFDRYVSILLKQHDAAGVEERRMIYSELERALDNLEDAQWDLVGDFFTWFNPDDDEGDDPETVTYRQQSSDFTLSLRLGVEVVSSAALKTLASSAALDQMPTSNDLDALEVLLPFLTYQLESTLGDAVTLRWAQASAVEGFEPRTDCTSLGEGRADARFFELRTFLNR